MTENILTNDSYKIAKNAASTLGRLAMKLAPFAAGFYVGINQSYGNIPPISPLEKVAIGATIPTAFGAAIYDSLQRGEKNYKSTLKCADGILNIFSKMQGKHYDSGFDEKADYEMPKERHTFNDSLCLLTFINFFFIIGKYNSYWSIHITRNLQWMSF